MIDLSETSVDVRHISFAVKYATDDFFARPRNDRLALLCSPRSGLLDSRCDTVWGEIEVFEEPVFRVEFCFCVNRTGLTTEVPFP